MSELPPVRVHHPHVEARADLLAGSPLVRGTKVPVRRLWTWHRKCVTVETLVKRYPALGPAKVLDALAFAYDNQDVLDADIERERDLLDAEMAKQPPLPKTRSNRRAASSSPGGPQTIVSDDHTRASGDGIPREGDPAA